jgi:hypothetical protein
MAQALAARLEHGGGATGAQQVNEAYLIAFQREPTADERAAAVELIAAHGLPAFCRALLNLNELIYLD